jgi:hypothetical protein
MKKYMIYVLIGAVYASSYCAESEIEWLQKTAMFRDSGRCEDLPYRDSISQPDRTKLFIFSMTADFPEAVELFLDQRWVNPEEDETLAQFAAQIRTQAAVVLIKACYERGILRTKTETTPQGNVQYSILAHAIAAHNIPVSDYIVQNVHKATDDGKLPHILSDVFKKRDIRSVLFGQHLKSMLREDFCYASKRVGPSIEEQPSSLESEDHLDRQTLGSVTQVRKRILPKNQ